MDSQDTRYLIFSHSLPIKVHRLARVGAHVGARLDARTRKMPFCPDAFPSASTFLL